MYYVSDGQTFDSALESQAGKPYAIIFWVVVVTRESSRRSAGGGHRREEGGRVRDGETAFYDYVRRGGGVRGGGFVIVVLFPKYCT